jgi:hypothetical protein
MLARSIEQGLLKSWSVSLKRFIKQRQMPILKQPCSLGQLTRVISDRSQYIDLLRAFAMELTSEQAEILKAFKTDAGADKRFFSFNRNSVNLPFCSCARISE